MEKEILVVEYIYFILGNAVEDRSCLDFSLEDVNGSVLWSLAKKEFLSTILMGVACPRKYQMRWHRFKTILTKLMQYLFHFSRYWNRRWIV